MKNFPISWKFKILEKNWIFLAVKMMSGFIKIVGQMLYDLNLSKKYTLYNGSPVTSYRIWEPITTGICVLAWKPDISSAYKGNKELWLDAMAWLKSQKCIVIQPWLKQVLFSLVVLR